ncbi:hypothetical protein ID866_11203, partial [Astraeus odoratus]
MSPTSPSGILTDAVAAFNRAATLAINTAQEQARKDITQAAADTRDARRERDEAVQALHASRLEEQAWRQEAAVWKAATDQAELTIKHHLETIAQLRQEATQWKEQCLRLEETSRQEAVSWKEQFLRVEQERSKLSKRVDDLISEQLSVNAQTPVASAPVTPLLKYVSIGDLSTSARLQKPPAYDSQLSDIERPAKAKSASEKSKPPSGASRPRALPTPTSESRPGTRLKATQNPLSRAQGSTIGERQVLVRRVQAVVEVPVKEESIGPEVADDGVLPSAPIPKMASASTSKAAPTQAPKQSQAATRVKRKAAAKRTYVEVDSSDNTDVSYGSDASDNHVGANANSDDDDDDELMMGAEDNRIEVYGIKHVQRPSAPTKEPSSQSTAKPKKLKLVPPAAERRSRPAGP